MPSGLYLSTNNGTSWTSITTGLPGFEYIRSADISGNTIYVGISAADMLNEGIFRSTDNGTNWTKVTTGLSSLSIYK